METSVILNNSQNLNSISALVKLLNLRRVERVELLRSSTAKKERLTDSEDSAESELKRRQARKILSISRPDGSEALSMYV